MKLLEADLDAQIRAQRDAADAASDDDAQDHARAADYPHWSDELDQLQDQAVAPLRRIALGLVATGLVGAILVFTLGPGLWHAVAGLLPSP